MSSWSWGESVKVIKRGTDIEIVCQTKLFHQLDLTSLLSKHYYFLFDEVKEFTSKLKQ